jgi:glucose-specific phosphotransferase system IIA component
MRSAGAPGLPVVLCKGSAAFGQSAQFLLLFFGVFNLPFSLQTSAFSFIIEISNQFVRPRFCQKAQLRGARHSRRTINMGFFSNLFKKNTTPEPAPAPAAPAKAEGPQVIGAPLEGEVRVLSEIEDPVFSSEALGKGCAIEPSKGEVVAPFDGTIEQVAETKHAVGIMGDNGVEVLIHVGMDTVELNGKGYEPQVAVGDKVKKGQLLLKFDMDVIKNAGYILTTPVVVTNTDDYASVEAIATGAVKQGDDVVRVQ